MAEPIGRDGIRAAIAAQLHCADTEIADDANLIEQGLNSMSMMALAGGWRRRGVHITFAELAADPTVAGWHRLLDAAEPAPGPEPARSPEPAAAPAGDDGPFPLAPMQHAYWIGRSGDQQLGGVAAHLYVEFDGGPVDPQRLERAVTALVAMHPMLRTRFLPDGTQQTLTEPGRPVFTVVDLRGQGRERVESRLAELRDRKTHQRLSVEDGQVIDVTLTRCDEGRSRVHLDVDMLAADAMSYRVLAADLAELYRGAAVPAPGYSYRRYRTEHAADDAARDRDRDWWRRRLPGLPGAPQLPAAPGGAKPADHRTARHAHWLDPEARRRLVAGAHARGITPAMAVAAVFADTIGGWSAQSRFLLNIPLFHRQPVHPDIDRVVGDFTSSVLLEVDVTDAVPVAERARQIQRRMYDSAGHAGYPGLDVLRDLGRHQGEPVLAPIVFTSALDLGELFAGDVVETFGEPVWIVSQGPQVLLDAQVTELRGGLLLNWDVRESMFPAGLVDTMFARFTAAVDALAGGDAGWDADAAVRLPVDQARVRAAVNATDGPVRDRCLHRGFFDNAAAHPNAPAVLFGAGAAAGVWSYGGLAEAALAVAGALHAHGVRPGATVAVRLPRGRDQVLAVLGVLAAGAAYLPIGFDQPDARCAKILQTAGAVAMITAGAGGGDAPVACLPVDAARSHPVPLPRPIFGDTGEIAYVIFTSGSTGLPKGVAVSHRAAMNTIDALNERFAVGPADRALALAALEFDLSVYDIFGMFSAGGALVAADGADPPAQSAQAWVELIGRHGVSILNCVPSALDMILTAGAGRLGGSLRAVLLGGDWVPTDLARRLAGQVPGCRFAGLGGATETSIHSTICEIAGAPPQQWSTVPFGTPLRNVHCRVVAPSGRDCPDWVAGELWVGGAGVAAGYRNDERRTAQRFVEHDGLRWYKTGDIARYWPDGTVEFLGRADHQVQIRGYRVELGEVESALRAAPGVHRAVAAVIGAGAPTLAAAVEGDRDRIGDAAAVGAAVAELLPRYMVPARIIVLERIPLTPNGKLDRGAVAGLLAAQAGGEDTGDGADTGDSAAGDPATAALAAIAAEVLGVDSVGAHRDFFAMGGDSVLATSVIARVRDWLDIDHAVVADLFAARTVAGLAERLARREAQRGTPHRLVAVSRLYLEVAAMTDDEVLAQE